MDQKSQKSVIFNQSYSQITVTFFWLTEFETTDSVQSVMRERRLWWKRLWERMDFTTWETNTAANTDDVKCERALSVAVTSGTATTLCESKRSVEPNELPSVAKLQMKLLNEAGCNAIGRCKCFYSDKGIPFRANSIVSHLTKRRTVEDGHRTEQK